MLDAAKSDQESKEEAKKGKSGMPPLGFLPPWWDAVKEKREAKEKKREEDKRKRVEELRKEAEQMMKRQGKTGAME